MPTETEPTTASLQKTDDGDKSLQCTGLTQQTRPSAIANSSAECAGASALSIRDVSYDSIFSFRRMADEFVRALQPLASEGEIDQAIAWTPPPSRYPSAMASSTSLPNFLIVA